MAMYVLVEIGLGAHAKGVSYVIIGKYEIELITPAGGCLCKLPRTSRTFLPSANLEWHAARNVMYVDEQAMQS